jgi:hypothetical protein
MHRPPAYTLGLILVLSLLAGCAFEPYPPLPYLPEPQPVAAPSFSALPGRAPVPEPVAEPASQAAPGLVSGPVKPRKRGAGRQLTIRLKSQRFEYIEGGELVRVGEISSGSAEHPTPKGSFRVLSKEEDKRSRSYTNYFNQPTPMPYALQFYGPYFVHEGWLPGHADSHGCVRLHYEDAKFVFERIRVGDRVAVVD